MTTAPVLLTRRALAGCGALAIMVGTFTGWIVAAAQVIAQTGGLTGVQAYAGLLSAIFGAFVGAVAALGAFGGYAIGVAVAPTSRVAVAACVGGGAVVAIGSLLALGTGGTLGWRPVSLTTVGLGAYVFAAAAIGYLGGSRSARRV